MDDIRKRYEEVVSRCDAAKQSHLEAKANIKALQNRREELAQEAAALGVSDLDLLDESIQTLEDEIDADLEQVEQQLEELGSDSPVKVPLAKPQVEPVETMDLNALLTEGGEPQRKIP